MLQDLGTLDFGKGVTSEANVALWRTRGEHQPRVGEFAFQFKRRADVHDKARERCAKFFIRLQQIGSAWIYLGATKTGMVYRLREIRRRRTSSVNPFARFLEDDLRGVRYAVSMFIATTGPLDHRQGVR